MRSLAPIFTALLALGQVSGFIMNPKPSYVSGVLPADPPAFWGNTKTDQVGYRESPATVYMSIRNANAIAVLDANSGEVKQVLKGLGGAPHGVWVNETLGLLFVADSVSPNPTTGLLYAVKLDAPLDPPVWRLELHGCDIIKQYGNNLYVTAFNGLNIIDAATGIAVGKPVEIGSEDFTVSETSNAIYFSSGMGGNNVIVGDAVSRKRNFRIDLGTQTSIFAQSLSSNINRLFVTAQGSASLYRNPNNGVRKLPVSQPTARPTKRPTKAPSRRPTKSPTR
jgi:DNA-binding beta-propeller fold protein YncE